MKQFLFFFSCAIFLFHHAVSLASDNVRKYPIVRSEEDLALLGEPRSLEEHHMLQTIKHSIAIDQLLNGSEIARTRSDTRYRLLFTRCELLEKKVKCQKKRVNKIKKTMKQQNQIMSESNQKLEDIKDHIKFQNTAIKGLVFATVLLSSYVVAKELYPLFKKDL